MNIDLTDNPVRLSMKIARVCDPYTAVLYSALLEGSKNGIAEVSKTELSKITNIPKRSLTTKITKLSELGLINVELENGNVTRYHVKNIFEDAASEQPPAKISRQEQEPEPVSEPAKKVKKSHGYQVPYFVMLDNIGSDLASECPKSDDDIKGYERNTEKCTIPEEWAFSNYPAMVEDALKYLAYYSDIERREYKKFVAEVCTCLAEAICNGRKGNTHSVEPVVIIRRINEIIHDDNYSFGQWLHDFGAKYDDYLRGHAETIYNKHNFLKTCAVNYLTEHRAGVMPEFTEFDNRKDWL